MSCGMCGVRCEMCSGFWVRRRGGGRREDEGISLKKKEIDVEIEINDARRKGERKKEKKEKKKKDQA